MLCTWDDEKQRSEKTSASMRSRHRITLPKPHSRLRTEDTMSTAGRAQAAWGPQPSFHWVCRMPRDALSWGKALCAWLVSCDIAEFTRRAD